MALRLQRRTFQWWNGELVTEVCKTEEQAQVRYDQLKQEGYKVRWVQPGNDVSYMDPEEDDWD